MGLTQITTGGVDDNINIDSNTLKVDGTNNRVGIGTAAPGTDLEVYNTTGPSFSLNDGGDYKSYFTLLVILFIFYIVYKIWINYIIYLVIIGLVLLYLNERSKNKEKSKK